MPGFQLIGPITFSKANIMGIFPLIGRAVWCESLLFALFHAMGRWFQAISLPDPYPSYLLRGLLATIQLWTVFCQSPSDFLGYFADVSAIYLYSWDKASLGTSSFAIFSARPFYHSFFRNKCLPWLLLLIVCLFSVVLIWAFIISFFLLSSSNSDEVARDSSITQCVGYLPLAPLDVFSPLYPKQVNSSPLQSCMNYISGLTCSLVSNQVQPVGCPGRRWEGGCRGQSRPSLPWLLSDRFTSGWLVSQVKITVSLNSFFSCDDNLSNSLVPSSQRW